MRLAKNGMPESSAHLGDQNERLDISRRLRPTLNLCNPQPLQLLNPYVLIVVWNTSMITSLYMCPNVARHHALRTN